MLKSHEKFFTQNGKRLILVGTEDPQERSFFEEILKDEYLLMFAPDYKESESLLRESSDVLSMVILHLREPHRAALKLLELVQKEPELRHIPVMVVDEDRDIEIEALQRGAMAVIVLPYPMKEVVRARIRRTIELSEDRAIISSTERDPLTGLYNREFFYQYAEQYDHHHRAKDMDAIVIDVNNFRIINERFGSDYGDIVLRRIGERVRDMVKDSGGIVCRREADVFQIYCPHGRDYQAILDNASIGVTEDESTSDRIRLRMGVYKKVDKNLPMDRRFERANMAANSLRANYMKNIAIYDSVLHQKEVEDARLVEELNQALRGRQFQVYYQPKFDIRGEAPILTSAEALVRWQHPKQGLMSPQRFIPLFEENGLIQPLDHYVWETVAKQIREWKSRLGFSVPVSVNVSRVHMYDPDMVKRLMKIVKNSGLTSSDIYLEITESAYIEDSEQIVRRVELLRDLGFKVEMDDFGTGYSSLNVISTLPIDVLKLDREIVRTAFPEGERNTRMIEIMLDIADYLEVPVVAEGVETGEQLQVLKDLGCEVIQGYYFSRPVPAQEFERFLIRRMDQGAFVPVSSTPSFLLEEGQRQEDPGSDRRLQEIANTLFGAYSSLFDVDPVSERYVEYHPTEDGSGLRVEKEGTSFFNFPERRLFGYLHPEDRQLFKDTFAKDHVVQMLEKQRRYSGVFRLMIGEEPSFIYVQAARTGNREHRRFVFGICIVDVRFRTEQRYQTIVRTIGRDPLTGTKSMNAYIQEERRINEAITWKEVRPFAIAIVDIKGYRQIKEEKGKKAAEEAVCWLSEIVCDVFDHSPVYRIGDDEFVAILQHRDYENRAALADKMRMIMEENNKEDRTSFFFGIADFDPEQDKRLSSVFERASRAMGREI